MRSPLPRPGLVLGLLLSLACGLGWRDLPTPTAAAAPAKADAPAPLRSLPADEILAKLDLSRVVPRQFFTGKSGIHQFLASVLNVFQLFEPCH